MDGRRDCGLGVGRARWLGLQTLRRPAQQLAEILDEGPVTQGWDDARWTLARVAEVIERRFAITYMLRGVSYLLHRIGWTPQVPARRAVERDADAIAAWRAVSGATPAPMSRP